MFPSAKFVTIVSIDKGIYYATQRKLISRSILPCDPPYTSQWFSKKNKISMVLEHEG
jgi:hypothetical protein